MYLSNPTLAKLALEVQTLYLSFLKLKSRWSFLILWMLYRFYFYCSERLKPQWWSEVNSEIYSQPLQWFLGPDGMDTNRFYDMYRPHNREKMEREEGREEKKKWAHTSPYAYTQRDAAKVSNLPTRQSWMLKKQTFNLKQRPLQCSPKAVDLH